MEIQNKTVLLTGASRGIGPYIAKTLANAGAVLIGLARSEEGLNTTKAEIEYEGGTFHTISFDLKNINGLSDLVEQATTINGEIDILVNNAGIELCRKYQNYSADEIRDVLNVNLHAPLELSRLLLPAMLDRGGHIVTVASLAGKKGMAYNTPYSASKAGLIMWTDGMRQELRGTKVGISVICPGFISDTGMFYEDHVDPPVMLGTSKPQAVADAVIKAIKNNSAEIIVNKGPMKPLLAIGQISPSFGDKIVRKFGVIEFNKKRIKK